MDTAILVKDLCKKYGNKIAIQKLNFEVKTGSIVGFLGPNGAGKSTTLRILSGLLAADSGCVYIHGLPITTQAQAIKQHIGYMPENNPLPDDMRIEEYLSFRAQLKGVAHKDLKKTVREVMERCDLYRTASRKMLHTLSKGFRQRVGIAEALLGKPKLIILDEPTIGLDPHQIIGIRDLLKSLKGETTVIFSSHILPEVEAACSHLIILNQGNIVAQDTPLRLRQKFFKSNRYEISFSQEIQDFKERLDTLPCAPKFLKKQQSDHGWTYVIECDTKTLPQEQDFIRWIVAQNWPLSQFVRKDPNLETLFLKLTSATWKQKEKL